VLPNHIDRRRRTHDNSSGKKCWIFIPEAVKIRRDLHRIPEPCLQETKTAQYVTAYLEKLGLEIETGIAQTGIKAVLRGAKPGPVVGIRADMDALPLNEDTGLTFTSEHPGFMHACGHDGHMTNVLISAKILSEMRERIAGTIVFIFQPCEEGNTAGKSGAHLMIEAGVLENPRIEAMLGLHVMPDFPVGSVALRPGPLMANVVFFEVVIKGKSSHGALPHQGIDAVHISALAIQQFQAIISRLKDPGERAVLSVGSIHGGTAANIISDRVVMRGTVRSFSFETENAIEKQMRNVLEGLALTYGMEFDFEFDRSAQYVHNDPELTEVVTNQFSGDDRNAERALDGADDDRRGFFGFQPHDPECFLLPGHRHQGEAPRHGFLRRRRDFQDRSAALLHGGPASPGAPFRFKPGFRGGFPEG
jgi:amidohydrolase